jgi:putative membrane protein
MENLKPLGYGNASDHLANERTFLAWVRTSVGIMAFGFVVVKFTLFVKQLALLLHQNEPAQKGYSATIGIFLVGFGALVGLMAFYRYLRVEKQLRTGVFRSSKVLATVLAVFIFLIGILLVAYLIHSID